MIQGQLDTRFNFFAPAELIKGQDRAGQEQYKVRGIISDDSKDFDGENVSPEGLDFSEFTFINWDHKKEPKYLIGEPEKWKHVPNKGIFMEGSIYPDSEVGLQAIALMKSLKNSKRGNKLAWSIEGEVLERDLINPKRVKRAKVTAVALCPFPKNGNTWAELIEKGFTGEAVFQDKDKLEFEEANGGDVYIIDETLENGDRMLVDKEGNIEIQKAQDTTNSRALIREDVEGNEKFLQKSIVVLVEGHKQGLCDDSVIEKAQKFKKFLE